MKRNSNHLPHQPPLVGLEPDVVRPHGRHPRPLDPDSEALLAAYLRWRVADGAAAATARGEAGQLRSLCREVGAPGRLVPLDGLLGHAGPLAVSLSGRTGTASLATNHRRLCALGHLSAFLERYLQRDLQAEMDALYALLPPRPAPSWDHTGVTVGGARAPRHRTGPTLLAGDLAAVAAAGPRGTTYRAVRDRAILMLACYTALGHDEIAALRWEAARPVGEAGEATIVTVVRHGREVALRGYGAVGTALTALAAAGRRRFGAVYGIGGAGPVFPGRGGSSAPLTGRQVATVAKAALAAAGFPLARRRDLLRAYVHWLRANGLADHEAMRAAGIHDARTLDRLLERAKRLGAQRVVAEFRDPW